MANSFYGSWRYRSTAGAPAALMQRKLAGDENTVSVSARPTPVNDRIDDTRCAATTKMLLARADAASAKWGKRMTAKSALQS